MVNEDDSSSSHRGACSGRSYICNVTNAMFIPYSVQGWYAVANWPRVPGCDCNLGPPPLIIKGAPLVKRYNFVFFVFFYFTVEKQENMLGPLCVTNKNVASFNKSYTRHFICPMRACVDMWR